MKITETTIVKQTLSDLDRLDPVTFIAENMGNSAGKLTVDCFGKAWTCYWGSMGSSVLEFIHSANTEYIAEKMFDGRSTITDYDKISSDIGDEVDRDTMAYHTDQLADKYGPEWYMDLPSCTNPDYSYLCRIVDAVKKAVAEKLTDLAA